MIAFRILLAGLIIAMAASCSERGLRKITIVPEPVETEFRKGTLILEEPVGIHAPIRVSGQIALESGLHPFELQFFEGNHGQQLELEVKKGGAPVKPEYFSLLNAE